MFSAKACKLLLLHYCMMVFYRYILFSLVILISLAGPCQSFFTDVSSQAMGKKDLLEVKYIAENLEITEFLLPDFKGWTIQSGPNLSSNRLQTGKIVKQQVIYSFILQPNRTGKLSVPSATIRLDQNNSRQSNTITIDVKDNDHVAGSLQMGGTGSLLFDEPSIAAEDFSNEQVLKKGEDALKKIRENLLIKLEVNKTTCFVGEPLLVTYKLCTRLKSQSRVIKQPSFTGCTVIEMTTNDFALPEQELVNGRMYNVYIIRKVQLFPLQPGTLALPETTVDNKVSFYKAGSTDFRQLYYNPAASPGEEKQLTLASKPMAINVKPLPAASEKFSGAIGTFNIAALKANDSSITTNNTAYLQVIIRGEGNLQQMKAPVVKWPAGIEAFEPSDEEEVDNSTFPVRVKKTFTFPFVVSKKGSYTIPPVDLNYLEPTSGKYITVFTRPVSFKVKKGHKLSFAFIKNADGAVDFQARLFILLACLLIAVFTGLALYNRKHKVKAAAVILPQQTPPLQPEVTADTQQLIQRVRDLNPLESGELFYKQLHRYIADYLKAKFNIAPSDLDSFAGAHPGEEATLQQVKALLNDCNLGMYTPVFDAEEAMAHRLQAICLLNKIEKMGEFGAG